MKPPIFRSLLKLLLQLNLVAVLILGACAQIERTEPTNDLLNPTVSKADTDTISLDKSIEDLQIYLETLKLYDVNTLLGSTHIERLKSADWLTYNMAKDLVKHGIDKDKLLKITDNDVGAAKLLGRRIQSEANFQDYLKLAEIAVIARVGDETQDSPEIYAGPAFFNLVISDILAATSDIENITVVNSLNAHHRRLYTGRECVFFLSPTYTKHFILREKEYPNLPDYLRENLPDGFLISRFPTYCLKEDEIFARASWGIEGTDEITRSEILNLVKVIP